MKTFLSASLLSVAALCFTACSQAPAPTKQAAAKKPVEPATGQSAIFQMYQVARTWAPDAEILKVSNGDIPEAKPQPGKYGLWTGTFVSAAKKQKRDFTYAVSDSDTIVKGVRAGSDMPYTANRLTMAFAIQEVKIDTPAALETAAKEIAKDKAMSKVLEENKDLPVQYLLEWTSPNKKPAWRVIYGPSISQSKFSIFVDANSGAFLKKQH